MIQLIEDKLRFSFREVTSDLENRIKSATKETIDRLLASSRQGALAKLQRNTSYQRASAEARARGEQQLLMADASKVARLIENLAEVAAQPMVDDAWAGLSISFQRTLRIPDDGRTYPLPAGFGEFPIRHVDDFSETVPAAWQERGGVLLPMYQSEAMWIRFDAGYPFAIQIAAGKINAASGGPWSPGLQRSPQNYLIVPDQPWLDGFAVERGVIRQFVAMPLGAGYSVEEQLTGKADVGGLQIQVFPLRADLAFAEDILPLFRWTWEDLLPHLIESSLLDPRPSSFSRMRVGFAEEAMLCCRSAAPSMGLGAGGKMRQEIYHDSRPLSAWDTSLHSRCFVHLCNSTGWREITGEQPPHPPFTAKEYKKHGVPWFDYYRDDLAALPGSDALAGVKSVATVAAEKGDPLSGNGSLQPKLIIQHGNAPRPNVDIVREWTEV
jgi:hypothetical protein